MLCGGWYTAGLVLLLQALPLTSTSSPSGAVEVTFVNHGSPGHGADHVLPGLVSPSVTVPVSDGEPLLGTWQSIVLVDLNRDNARRHVRLSFLPG